MNEAEIVQLVRRLSPLVPDLYKVVDQFHDQASDEWDLNMLKTVNDLSEIVDFLKDQLSEDSKRIPPPQNPNITTF